MTDTELKLRDYEAGVYGGLKAIDIGGFAEEVDQDKNGAVGPTGSRTVDFDASERGALRRIEQDRSNHRRFHRAFCRLTPQYQNVLLRYASDIGGQKFRVGGLGSYHPVALLLPNIMKRAEIAGSTLTDALREAVKGDGLAQIEKRCAALVDAAMAALSAELKVETDAAKASRPNPFVLVVAA